MKVRKYAVIATESERRLIPAKERNREVIVTGVGGTNAILALRDIPRDADILNIGYAGSLHLPIGTQVRVGRVRLYHPNATFAERTFELASGSALCLTAGDFVEGGDIEKDAVVDMELAYIAALGFTNIKAIKVISDNLRYKQYERTIK